jgi:hypothetical protein
MFQVKVIKTIKTRVLCSVIFFREWCRLRYVKIYGRAVQDTDDNVTRHMRCACWVTKATNTFKICDTNCFSMAPVVTRTRLIRCIQNIPDWCRHLYSSCGSAKHRWMVGLPCLVNQCAKLHVAEWTWAAFIRVQW